MPPGALPPPLADPPVPPALLVPPPPPPAPGAATPASAEAKPPPEPSRPDGGSGTVAGTAPAASYDCPVGQCAAAKAHIGLAPTAIGAVTLPADLDYHHLAGRNRDGGDHFAPKAAIVACPLST